MKKSPRYYVRIYSFWQGAPSRYVGPFGSRNTAKAAITEAVKKGALATLLGNTSSDLKNGYLVSSVLSHTAAKRVGLVDDLFEANYNLLDHMPRDADEMHQMLGY